MTYTDGTHSVTVAKRNTQFGVRYHVTGKLIKDGGTWLDEHTFKIWQKHWEANGLVGA